MLNNGTFNLPSVIEQKELPKWSRKTHPKLAMEVERDASVCKTIMPSARGVQWCHVDLAVAKFGYRFQFAAIARLEAMSATVVDSFWILLFTSCTIAEIMTSRGLWAFNVNLWFLSLFFLLYFLGGALPSKKEGA